MKKDSNVKTDRKQRYPRTRDPPVYLQEQCAVYLHIYILYLHLPPTSAQVYINGFFPCWKCHVQKNKKTTKILSEPKNAEKRIFSKKNRDIVTWLSSDLHFLEANNSCIHSHLIYTHLFHKCICCVLHWITMQLWNSLVCVNTTVWQQYLLKHTSLQSQRAVFNRLCSCVDHNYW